MKDRDNKGRFIKGNSHPPERKKVDIEYCKKKYQGGYSCFDICKKFNVNEATIRNRFKEVGFKTRKNNDHTNITKQKIRKTLIRKGIRPIIINKIAWNKGLTQEDERVKKNIQGLLENRKYQILPKKDTSIEVKIQDFLSQFHLEFFTHKYMNIRHAYQCDFFIPKQETEGIIITKNTIIETDGCYWHGCPKCNNQLNNKQKKQLAKDNRRTKELIGRGFNVIRLWEHEIKPMQLNDFKQKLK